MEIGEEGHRMVRHNLQKNYNLVKLNIHLQCLRFGCTAENVVRLLNFAEFEVWKMLALDNAKA